MRSSSSYLFMKVASAFIFLFFVHTSFSQVELSSLPAYDCSLKKVMTLIGNKTVVVSPDNSTGLNAILADYCGTLGNNCTLKKESELTPGDYNGNILSVGILQQFKNWPGFTTPVKKIKGGFCINGKNFTDSADGFAFVDTNRIIIAGNSLTAVKDAQLALTGGHDILVVQHGKITYFGNRKNKTGFNWFNLQNLKHTNYTNRKSELFSAIYISRTFRDAIDYPALNATLRAYVKRFIGIYQVPMPNKKVSWFLHSNMREYGTMSGMFGLTCPGNNSAGFSIRGEIHTNGFDTGLVKHEYSHYLFDAAIPQDNNPAFFVEGCVEYVTNLNDPGLYAKRVSTAKKFRDTLNYADLIIRNKDFYGQYSAANYSVCGVFVQYLVSRFGVDAFKRYCLAPDKRKAANEFFKEGFDAVVEGYKKWLVKM